MDNRRLGIVFFAGASFNLNLGFGKQYRRALRADQAVFAVDGGLFQLIGAEWGVAVGTDNTYHGGSPE
jgi:hypothetical protein